MNIFDALREQNIEIWCVKNWKLKNELKIGKKLELSGWF